MAKRSLILTTNSQGGKKIQKTITDINPNADSETMLAFAQKLNALTTNTYERTDCVEKYNIDTEDAPSKPEPTLTVTNGTGVQGITRAWLEQLTIAGDIRHLPITYNGDGELYAYTDLHFMAVGISFHNSVPEVVAAAGWGNSVNKPSSFETGKKVYLVATEGENYAAKTIEIALD